MNKNILRAPTSKRLIPWYERYIEKNRITFDIHQRYSEHVHKRIAELASLLIMNQQNDKQELLTRIFSYYVLRAQEESPYSSIVFTGAEEELDCFLMEIYSITGRVPLSFIIDRDDKL